MNRKSSITLGLKLSGSEISRDITRAYCVGYSGRNIEKTKEHIQELAKIGVPEPDEIPALFPVSTRTVTQNADMEVVGAETSGEVELVLIYGKSLEESLLTVGSDHTDRGLEAVDIGKGKQACDKPIAEECWELKPLLANWDKLQMSSEVRIDGVWTPYQSDTAAAMMPLADIIAYLERKKVLHEGGIYFLGTVPLLSGFKYGDAFRAVLKDPDSGREISCEYGITNLLSV